MITNKELYDFLKNKGVVHLHHANSVATAITYIQNGGLMSRGKVERNGLYQTPQKYDDTDKKYSIFDDIFFDVVDLHKWTYHKNFSEQYKESADIQPNSIEYKFQSNFYGPVLFKYKLELLLCDDLPNIKITKKNPSYWKGTLTESDKYFENISDYMQNFEKNTYEKMITFSMQNKKIHFDYLDEILLDKCNESIGFCGTYHQIAAKALNEELQKIGKSQLLKIRNCYPQCVCHYPLVEKKRYDTKLMFLPNNINGEKG